MTGCPAGITKSQQRIVMNLARSSVQIRGSQRSGFTLLEMLVVLALMLVLASTILPALNDRHPRPQSARCGSNLRQLMIAWRMYADENRDTLVACAEFQGRPSWCTGTIDYTANNPTNWDVKHDITQSPLFAYVRNTAVWRCPADTSTVLVGSARMPRVRSVSMNQAFGTGERLPASAGYLTYARLTDLTRPGPAKTFVLADEHPDSINDVAIAVQMSDGFGITNTIVDYPASYHGGGCGYSFADGHVEIHKWLDPRTQPPIRGVSGLQGETVQITRTWCGCRRTPAQSKGARGARGSARGGGPGVRPSRAQQDPTPLHALTLPAPPLSRSHA